MTLIFLLLNREQQHLHVQFSWGKPAHHQRTTLKFTDVTQIPSHDIYAQYLMSQPIPKHLGHVWFSDSLSLKDGQEEAETCISFPKNPACFQDWHTLYTDWSSSSLPGQGRSQVSTSSWYMISNTLLDYFGDIQSIEDQESQVKSQELVVLQCNSLEVTKHKCAQCLS